MSMCIKKYFRLSLIGLFVLAASSCNDYDNGPNDPYSNLLPEELEGLQFWGLDSSGKDYKNNKIEASGVTYRSPKCLKICDKPLSNIKCNKQSTKEEIVKAKYGKIIGTACKMISELLRNIIKNVECGELLNKQKELICTIGDSLKKHDEEQILLKEGPIIICDYWFNLDIRNHETKKTYDKKFNFNECFKKVIDSSSEWEKFIKKMHCILNSCFVKHPKDVFVKICLKNNKQELARSIKSNDIIKKCLDTLQNAMLKNKKAFQKVFFGSDSKKYFSHFLCFINSCIANVLKNIVSFRPLVKDLKRLTSAYLKVDSAGLAFKAMLTFVHNQKKFVIGRVDESIRNIKNISIIKNLCIDYNDLVGVGCFGMNVVMNWGIGFKNTEKVSFVISLFKAYVKLLKHFVIDVLGVGDVDKIISCLS